MVGHLEFPERSLPDERLRRRANDMMNAMTEHHGLPFTAVYKEPAASLAAYRLVENDRLSFPLLTGALGAAFGQRIASTTDDTLLCVHDTTELELTRLVTAVGFGTVGNPECRGEFLHTSLILSVEGVFEGFLAAKTWVRPEHERGKAQTRRSRSFEEKESYRWWEQILEAEQRVPRRGLLLHVCDRESDVYGVLQRACAQGVRLLVRAAQNRRVDDEARLLWDTCSKWRVRDTRLVRIPPHRESPETSLVRERSAQVELRFGQVPVRPPHAGERPTEPLLLNAVFIREINPPEGVEPIEWLLLTTDPLPNVAAAWRHIDYYRLRWSIEEFHKCLKTGCKVEERQYQERDHFDVALALALPVALRILRLTKLSRQDPHTPAAHEFDPVEIAVLFGVVAMTSPPTLAQAVLKIAQLGGYLGRRHDGPVGWLRFWRGYARLAAQVEGYLLARSP